MAMYGSSSVFGLASVVGGEDADDGAGTVAATRRESVARAKIELDRKVSSALLPQEPGKVMREVGADISHGLSSEEARSRLLRDGRNELDEHAPPSVLELLALQSTNLLLWLLIGASIASFSLEEEVEGTAVLIIVALNVCITVISEKGASDALASLSEMAQPVARVVRDGTMMTIPTAEVVVGDTVVLRDGDVVPADCVLVQSRELRCEESLLTGESREVPKSTQVPSLRDFREALTPCNEVFSSTTIVAGEGIGVVTKTGMDTRVGAIAALLGRGEEDENKNGWCGRLGRLIREQRVTQTPLQRNLHKLGLQISAVALICCAAVFLIGVLRNYRDPEHPANSPAASMLLVSVSLAVSAIPEGLPLCVTICLALGTTAMAKRKALVRTLPAVEVLGSAQVVCSDKTGTLTTGKMTLVRMALADVNLDREAMPTNEAAQSVLEAAARNSSAHIDKDGKVTGTATEVALVRAAKSAGIDLRPEEPELTVPFNSKRKMMASVFTSDLFHFPTPSSNARGKPQKEEEEEEEKSIEGGASTQSGAGVVSPNVIDPTLHGDKPKNTTGDSSTPYVALIKGAPDLLLSKCTHALDGEGRVKRIDMGHVLGTLRAFNQDALRTLAVVWVPLSELPSSEEPDERLRFIFESDVVVLGGLVGCLDPPRPEVPAAVDRVQEAGVRVIMITGDHVETAAAIARDVHILRVEDNAEEAAVDCRVLQDAAPHEVEALVSRASVFARAKPEDKLILVEALRRRGLVTAMTGDGVNDAPSLAASDIGVAMGTGTDVARSASGLVLLDDNFATIEIAIHDGRVIYSRIQRFITYLLGTNASQVFSILICVATGLPIPLKPLAILLLNLAIDGAPAMAISVEPGAADTMKHPPRPQTQPILIPSVLRRIITHAIATTFATLTSFILGLYFFAGAVFLVNSLADLDSDDTCFVLQPASGDYQLEWIPQSGDHCRIVGLERARTMAFATMVLCEITRAFTVRDDAFSFHPSLLFRNRPLLGGIGIATLLAALTLAVPAIQDVWDFAPLPWFAWLIVLALATAVIFADERLKTKQREDSALQRTLQNIQDRLERIA